MFSSNARRPMAGDKADTTAIVPGRACGECSLCCKLIRVDAFAKAPGTWCAHCAPGSGGGAVYDNPPAGGRGVFFAWGVSPSPRGGGGARPCQARPPGGRGGRLVAGYVGPSGPPGRGQGADVNQQVIVYIKNRVIAIFPNKEVEVGTMNPGDHLVVREVGGPDGRDWIAFIEAAGPPDAK